MANASRLISLNLGSQTLGLAEFRVQPHGGLVLLARGFSRSGEFELPVLLAMLMLGSGLVFLRFLERWL